MRISALLCVCTVSGLVALNAFVGSQDKTDEVYALRQLHMRAVHELEEGANENDPVPKSVQQLLEQATGVHVKGGEKEVSWADVLRETEFGFKRRNLKVTIIVNSKPGSCAVHYTPVVGGDGLDAGWTPAKFATDPKYYEIACSCGTNTPRLRIDAMSDREVQFRCEVSNSKGAQKTAIERN